MTLEIKGSPKSFAMSVLVAAVLCSAVGWATTTRRPVSAQSAPDAASPASAPLVWQPLNEPGSGGAMTAFALDPRAPKRLFVAGDMLGIGVSENGGESYGGGVGLPSFEIADFTFHLTDASIVWAGTMSGPAVSRDKGKTWQIKRGGFPAVNGFYTAPVEKILFVEGAKNTKHLLAFGGSSRRWNSPGDPAWGAIWESVDGGETWVRLVTLNESGATTGKGRSIVSATQSADGKTLLVGLDGAGVFRSVDLGKTWTPSAIGLPHPNIERVVCDPKSASIVYAALDNAAPAKSGEPFLPGGIYKSNDTGKTWQSINTGIDLHTNPDPNFTARFKAFAVSPANPQVLWAADSAWNKNAIYTSTDGGGSWTLSTTGANLAKAYPAGVGGSVFAAHPTDPKVAYSVGSENIIRTTDGGKTWTDAGNNPGKMPGSWRGRGYSGLCSIGFAFHPTKPGVAALTAMDAGKLWLSSDNLTSWTYHGNPPGGNSSPWGGGNDAALRGDEIYATTGQFGGFKGILRSRNAGKTWDVLAGAKHGLPEIDAANATGAGIYAPANGNAVVVVLGGKLYASGDSGETWTQPNAQADLDRIAGDPTNPARFYVSGKTGVFVSSDGGKTLAPVGTNAPCPAARLHCDKNGRLYAASWRTDSANAGLWRWDNKTWTRLKDDAFVAGVASDPQNPRRLILTTSDDPYHDESGSTGVWVSADDGATWQAANNGLPIDRGLCVAWEPVAPHRIVFGSMGRGYFVTQWQAGTLPK